MDENKSVITNEFDRSGRYDAGLKSLAKSLRVAFFLLLLGIAATLIYFVSGAGYFSVEPQQAVIVTRFGKVIKVCESGGYWFLPFPVHQFIRVQTSQQLLNVDFFASDVSGEGATSFEPGKDNYVITGDANIVHSSWTIAYRISNPEKYYLNLITPQFPVENGKVVPDDVFVDADGMKSTRGPITLLRNVFRRTVITVSAESEVNDILYAGQSKYSEDIKREFEKQLAMYDCGIVVDSVTLNRIFPPAGTKAAFDEVTNAGNRSDTLKNEARAYEKEQANEANAVSKALTASAQAYKDKVISRMKAQSDYFENIYSKNSGTLTMALYTEMLREVAAAVQGDKFLLAPQGKDKTLWLKLNPEPKSVTNAETAGEGK